MILIMVKNLKNDLPASALCDMDGPIDWRTREAAEAYIEVLRSNKRNVYSEYTISIPPRAPITLANGRVVASSREPDGSQLGYMQDGGEMSSAEFEEFWAIATKKGW